MQNIKLLDLQIGKYLELGNDWGYFGYYIKAKNPENFIYDITGEYQKTEPQEPLKRLCNLIGAVVYGDRYVLLECFRIYAIGDICKCVWNSHNEYCDIGYLGKDKKISNGFGLYDQEGFIGSLPNFKSIEILGNTFEEYSKQLRNELNKLNEFETILMALKQ